MNAPSHRPQLWPEITALMLCAMLFFTFTIGIGILNGSDIVDFDRRRVLGHVHSGTLGWLTLSVFAATLWLFGELRSVADRERQVVRGLVVLAVLSFGAYVAAFSTTYGNARPIFGVTSLAVIAGFSLWALYRARGAELSVPHLGFLAALGTSIVGGVLGVLLGLEIATGNNFLPDGGEDAHPATMTVGFLIPVALAMSEWAFFFPKPPRATRLGFIQMVFPFVGGIVLMLSLLFDFTALAPIAILLEFVGLGIFFYRLWPRFRQVPLLEATPARHAIATSLAILFALGLAQYWIIKYDGDFDRVPDADLTGLSHAEFIGTMTNAVFAMLLAATVGTVGSVRAQADPPQITRNLRLPMSDGVELEVKVLVLGRDSGVSNKHAFHRRELPSESPITQSTRQAFETKNSRRVKERISGSPSA